MTNVSPAPGLGSSAETLSRARPFPLGATVVPGGVDLSLYAKRATGVDLLLFDSADDEVARQVIPLDRHDDRTGAYWHRHVPGLQAGALYGYSVRGPWAPERPAASTRARSSSTRTGAGSPSRRRIGRSRPARRTRTPSR